MSSQSFFTKGLLISVALLPQLILSSPVASLAARATTTVTASIATLSPSIVSHGPLDAGALVNLLESLSESLAPIPTTTNAPDINRRQATSTTPLITTSSNGPFLAADMGGASINGASSECTPTTINGPIQTLQVFSGASQLRGLNATSLSGNSTSITSPLDNSVDEGIFVFNSNERIVDFFVFANDVAFLGFNFTTSEGRTYSAIGSTVRPNIGVTDAFGKTLEGVKVPVGSGIIGRIRGVHCQIGLFDMMGFDFIDDLQSISISDISYSGFTNNILPSGPGQTLNVGSQIIDNRNSTVDQTITLLTSDAVTQQHSLTVTVGFTTGGKTSIEASAGIPLIGSSKVTTEFNWQIQGSSAEQDLTSETVTKSATVNLKCPAKKFCVGSSFFTVFKIDVDVEATFNAKTKSGENFKWVQKGRYSGADSLAMKLQVDEADSPAAKRALQGRWKLSR